MMRFENRQEAGRKLAQKLLKYKGQDVVVYALPRGGVVLGREITKALEATLDLVITRKIGHPFHKEYALCAIAEDGDMICNESERTLVPEKWLKNEAEKERLEARRRREAYLKGENPVSCKNKTAIIVDDGIATGLTMFLAVKEIKHNSPQKIVVAVPASPRDVLNNLRKEVDEVVVLDESEFYLGSVGAYYEDFPQIEDDEVIKILSDF